jgi:hypothetical protein
VQFQGQSFFVRGKYSFLIPFSPLQGFREPEAVGIRQTMVEFENGWRRITKYMAERFARGLKIMPERLTQSLMGLAFLRNI